MKKGLLSLLVVALTVVGCQDYDDQFDSLNKEILALKTDLTTIKGLSTSITAISTEIKALEGKMVSDADITGILTQVAAVKAAVAAIPAPADVTGISTEVADLNSEIATILEQLAKIQAASGGTYTGNLNITNAVQLTAAEDIVDSSADGPKMTINGNVNIDADETGTKAAADQLRIQAILNKLKVVTGNVTITGVDAAMTASELLYVTGTLTVAGTSMMTLPKLNTVDGAVHFDLAGALSFPVLASAGSVEISETSTVTSVDLQTLVSGAVFTATDALILANATSVDVGGLPLTVTCAKATTFNSHAITNLTTSTITLAAATNVKIKAAKIAGGTVTIVANLAAVDLDATEMTPLSAAGVNIHAASISADSVTKLAATTLSATTISLAGLTAINDGGLTFKGPATFASTTLASAAGNFVSTTATAFNAPALTTSTGTINLKDGAVTVSVKNLHAPGVASATILDWATMSTLTLAGQTGSVSFTTAADLVTLNYTGAAGSGAYANDLLLTSANTSLTTVVLDAYNELESLTVSGTSLKSLSTAGVILDLVVLNNTALETLSFNHTHFDGQEATTVQIVGNTDPLFVAVDMSSLSKTKHVVITGNTSLTTIAAPSATVLAEPTALVTLTITGNLTQGTYTAPVVGTDTTPAATHLATSSVVSAFKVLINAYDAQTARTVTATYSLSIDQVDETGTAGDADVLFDDGTWENQGGTTGQIDTAAELALF